MLLLCLKYLSEEILPLLEMESKKKLPEYFNYQFSSVTQLCLTLCDPMDYSTPGFLVHHQLPELAQIHVHQVSDHIQPFHPLLIKFFLLANAFHKIITVIDLVNLGKGNGKPSGKNSPP